MTDHDPLKSAFGERRAAADSLDIDAGLAGVHRRNSFTHRAARTAAPLAVIIAAVVGVVWWAQGSGEGAVDDFRTTTTVPTDPTEVPPSTVVGEPEPQSASFIYTSGTDEVITPQATVTLGPEVEGPVTDAIDDLAGGLVIETDTALWHRPAGQAEAVKLVDQQPGGQLKLIDVVTDARDASTAVVYTDVVFPQAVVEALFTVSLDDSRVPVEGQEVTGSDTVIGGGAATLALDEAPDVAIGTGTDTCAQILVLRLGREQELLPRLCGESEPMLAVELTHDGKLVYVDADGLSVDRLLVTELPGHGPGVLLDVFEPWVVVTTPEAGLTTLVDLRDGSIASEGDVAQSVTSYRLARNEIDLGVRVPGTVVPEPGVHHPVTPGEYRVVGVAEEDMLNVRLGPGTDFAIEGGVENGGIVTATGDGRELPDGSIWMELAWPENQIVWANAALLELISGPSNDEFQCEGDNSPEPGTTVEVGDGVTAPGELGGVTETSFGHCVRTTIEVSGAEVMVAPDGNSLVVRLPASAEPTGDAVLNAGSAYVLRDAEGDLYIEILTGPMIRFGAWLADDGAAVVVDYAWATQSAFAAPFPAFADAGITIRDHNLDYRDDGTWVFTDRPTAFTGWARPFEANISLEVLDDQGQPYEEVQWRSGEGEVFGSSTYTMTTDWSSAWGEFSFEILDITPGGHTLRITGDGGSDTPRYLEIPFTVEP